MRSRTTGFSGMASVCVSFSQTGGLSVMLSTASSVTISIETLRLRTFCSSAPSSSSPDFFSECRPEKLATGSIVLVATIEAQVLPLTTRLSHIRLFIWKPLVRSLRLLFLLSEFGLLGHHFWSRRKCHQLLQCVPRLLQLKLLLMVKRAAPNQQNPAKPGKIRKSRRVEVEPQEEDDQPQQEEVFPQVQEQLEENQVEQEGGEGQEGQQGQEAGEGGQQGEDVGKVDLTDLQKVSLQIKEVLNILLDFKTFGRRPRKYYTSRLKALFCGYYGYNEELMAHFQCFMAPHELEQFLEANETPRPVTLRSNSLKVRRKELAQVLMGRGVSLDPVAEWSKVGIKVYESKVPLGATPEYLAGHYMLQSASSLLPVMALAPQAGDKVLDMAAAPGGKTTHICQLMKNSGVVYANDSKKQRLRALQFNLQRMGCTNAIVTNYDGRKIPSHLRGCDRVLLDAPCTGLGIIAKDPSIKAGKQMIDIYKHSHLQKELILAAIDCLKPGGTLVYSTCSVSPLENEEVVAYALKRRKVKLLEPGIEVGEPGLLKFLDKRWPEQLRLTRRIYPHVHNMDGFYFAKLRKNEA